MYKQLMMLGLLLEQPMYGQQIREVIEIHHDAFAQFLKKPTIYYQLDRLVLDGYLEVRAEEVEAPGPGLAHEAVVLRERNVYHITEAGKERFFKLLRETLSRYAPGVSDVEISFFFLHHLQTQEAITLLEKRRQKIDETFQALQKQHASFDALDWAHRLVNDHTATMLEAELRWLDRSIEHLRNLSISSQPLSSSSNL